MTKGPASLASKALEAYKRGNFDYAIALYTEYLKTAPGDVQARKALRAAEFQRLETRPLGALGAIISSILGLPSLLGAYFWMARKRPYQAMIACERILARNPRDPSAQGVLGHAAIAAGEVETAIFTFENLRELKPGHIPTLRTLGRLHRQAKNYAAASRRFQEIQERYPTDVEAHDAVRDLAALSSMEQQWETDGTFREKLRDKAEAEQLERARHIARDEDSVSSAIQDVEQALREKPDNRAAIFRLSDLYLQKGEMTQAQEVLSKFLEEHGEDFDVSARLGDLKLRELKNAWEAAVSQARSDPGNADLEQKAKEAKKAHDSAALAEFERRLKLHPTDLGLHYQLGLALYELMETDRAIAEFQQAVKDLKIRSQVLNMLGLCFIRNAIYDLAAEQFKKALDGRDLGGTLEKELRYNLAQAYELMNDYQAAREQLAKIYEVDITFRNVREKMEKLRAIGT